MFRAFLVVTLFCVAGCSDWPDVDTPRPSRASVGWPELVPISELPSQNGAETEESANETLLERAAALRARAAVLRRPVPDSAAFERMRARLAR